jgi:hypothetical protein
VAGEIIDAELVELPPAASGPDIGPEVSRDASRPEDI